MDHKDIPSKASLFVGRWQPFHDGHKALIETVLKQGKPAVVAIRDTEVDHKNPLSTSERWTRIQQALAQYGELVKIVVIPDIDEICYGRDVGYAIRKIELDDSTKDISGTKIRKATGMQKSVIWLTGQSGSGKTTLATALEARLSGVVLDGDEMRGTISTELGFSKEDREKHNIRVARLASVLRKSAPVIVSVIAPFEESRKKVDEIVKPFWVYVERDLPLDPNKPYEVPSHYHVKVNPDTQTLEEEVEAVLTALREYEAK